MELFAGAVIMIQINHRFGMAGKIRPPGVYLNRGDQQIKALGVLQALNDFKGDGYCGTAFVIAGMTMLNKAGIDFFPRATLNQITHPASCCQPLFSAFFAKVSFCDEIVLAELIEILSRIISAIETDQALSVEPKRLELLNASANKLGRSFLAMLLAGTQFAIKHVAFCTNVAEHRCISVMSFVGV